ncbi:MAG: ATP-binding protein [Chloroflexi bacterium]|nr:ATP-binding protein [Chloroflexota bacterium]
MWELAAAPSRTRSRNPYGDCGLMLNGCCYGYYGDCSRRCTCTPTMVTRYQKRISGPLLDRIDLFVDVPRVEYEKLVSEQQADSSVRAREQVARAFHRVLKVARTIADLAGSHEIGVVHLAEALQYRPRETAG